METFFADIASQVPALAVLTFVVIRFLSYLDKRDDMLRHIGDDCHEVQRLAIAAINENSRVLGETLRVVKILNNNKR